MDSHGFELMLGEMVNWMEHEVPDLLEDLGDDTQPNLDGCVLDGDSSTDRFVLALQKKAGEAASTNYCSNMQVIKCMNHLAKNCAKNCVTHPLYEVGHRLHFKCTCPVASSPSTDRPMSRLRYNILTTFVARDTAPPFGR